MRPTNIQLNRASTGNAFLILINLPFIYFTLRNVKKSEERSGVLAVFMWVKHRTQKILIGAPLAINYPKFRSYWTKVISAARSSSASPAKTGLVMRTNQVHRPL